MASRFGVRLGFALILLAGTCLLRWPGLEKKFWNVDEAVTFTMAQQILNGAVPYRDAVDQRPPLVPYLQAAVFAVAGDWNFRAQHTVLALMIGCTAILLWLTARRLGAEPAGVAAAAWFTLLAFMMPTVRDAMPAHTAWYLIFFSTLGFWAWTQAWPEGRTGWSFASGVAFGLSFLAKQPGLLDFGVPLVLVALGAWIEPAARGKSVRLTAALLGGLAVPVLFTLACFAAKGAWHDFAYYTWTYNNTLYVPEVPLGQRLQTIRVPFELAWNFHPLVVVIGGLAAPALLVVAVRPTRRPPRRFELTAWLILGWCATGLISTTLSGRGFSHYSIQLIPGLSLACGWLTARMWESGRQWSGSNRTRRALVLIAFTLAAIVLILPAIPHRRTLGRPDGDDGVVEQLVRRQTGPRDRIFVWGYTPEVYILSERLPATRFLYCTFLTGMIPWTNLDPLKDTVYAVVPGAWDGFLGDWQRHPPELVADGRSQRGFLKYPLERQPQVWPLIERDYAEVETVPAALHGFWLFRRTQPAPPHPPPADLTVSGEVKIQAEPTPAGRTARVAVQAPPGTRFLELYLDGMLYRRLPCAAGAPVTAAFFVLAADRPGPGHRVQAAAVAAGTTLASAEIDLAVPQQARVIGGPPLRFEGRDITALESSNITGGPILPKREAPEHWDAHPPSRLVYPRLPGMNSLAFGFGIDESALVREPPNGTDGIEVVVETEDRSGRITQVYRRYLDRVLAIRARGNVVDYTPLPPGNGGKIIMLMTPGPRFDISFDWGYWSWVRADRSPIALMAGGVPRPPSRVEAPAGLQQAEFNGRFITVTGAPAAVDFAATPELGELSGDFGLLDTAWLGAEKTAPVDFTVLRIDPQGAETRLFERTLDPVRQAGDRGVQAFKLVLPQPLTGTLRLATRTGGPAAPAKAFWGGLSVTRINLDLQGPAGPVPAAPRSRSDFGFNNTVEDGKACLFAHANSELVYPWQAGMTRLTGEFGIIAGAYTEGNTTPGVQFVVETENATGIRREIFRRYLAPSGSEKDRGPQSLSVALPPSPGGWIIVRTAAAPSGRLNNAWSYWRGLRAAP